MVPRFTESVTKAIAIAEKAAISLGASFVGTEHLLYGLLAIEDGVAAKKLAEHGVDRQLFQDLLNTSATDTQPDTVAFTPRTKQTLQTATAIASDLGAGYIGTEHILLAIISDAESYATKSLISLKVNITELRNELLFIMGEREMFEKASTQIPVINMSPFNDFSQGDKKRGLGELEKFGVDLTRKAKEGKLDPVVGRSKEIERIVQILSRRTKNNPILIGEPGVGKSAVAEGLAQAIVHGNVPELLKGKIVFSLDLPGMVAGTKYRGEFEERIKDAINRVSKAGNIILFIDEIHNIIGAGSSSESKMDAADIFKPLLARGELQTIGATTIEEYRKYIEKDSALERRFQPVMVEEPSVDETVEILKGLRDRYEAHHKVTITNEAITAAAELSHRYIMDRFLPDKAIDLIDEAASKARLKSFIEPSGIKEKEDRLAHLEQEKRAALSADNFEKAAVLRDEIRKLTQELTNTKTTWQDKRSKENVKIGEEEIADIVSAWTNIPVKKITEAESKKLLHLETEISKRVIGQKSAIEAVSKAIRRARAGLKDPKRPIGSFIFLGPTGVGKTELAKSVAREIFGDENAMIRVDMSEYMEKHTVSKLVGSPPGYVGYEETGQLTEKVRRRPYSVVLFDEIEKAHPDVFNMLLQILDDGRLTDNKGRVVSFKNTIIIMTSNAGAANIKKMKSIGFADESAAQQNDFDKMKEKLMASLKEVFRPEFLNRVDEIIVFHPLSEDDVRQILDVLLNDLAERVNDRVKLVFSDEAKTHLVKAGYDSEYGARPLKRAIQKEVEDRLSEELLGGGINIGDTVKVDFANDKLTFSTK